MSRVPLAGWAAVAALAAMASTRRDGVYEIRAETDLRPFDLLNDFDPFGHRPRRRVMQLPSGAPNDIGPIIDTTPESKRARRRRLAKGAKP